ncbi:MAG: zinc ABC transporter ATP-binding protein AztA [Actinomycetota bacterium]
MTIIFNKAGSPPPLLLTGVDVAYSGTAVFRGLTLAIAPGTVTAVVGANGSGKSTLLDVLAGVLRPQAGTVTVAARGIAFAVQRSRVTDSFPITVAEAVMMGRWHRLGWWRRPSGQDRAVVEHWLTELELTDLRHRTLGELSGGQRQRVLLAQTFAQQAELLLLDEPTTGLDRDVSSRVVAHLRRAAAAGTTVVAATHDDAVVAAAHQRIDLDAKVRG